MYLVKARQRLKVVVLAEVQHQCEQAEHLSVEAELQEEPVVILSYAVIDPGGGSRTNSHIISPREIVKNICCWAQSAVHPLTRDSDGPFCARSGRSGCSGGNVWDAWDCTCCTAPSAAALPKGRRWPSVITWRRHLCGFVVGALPVSTPDWGMWGSARRRPGSAVEALISAAKQRADAT